MGNMDAGQLGPVGEACRQCYFWEHQVFSNADTYDDEYGLCRRNAPQARWVVDVAKASEHGLEAVFPRTEESDWCGEYKVRKAVT